MYGYVQGTGTSGSSSTSIFTLTGLTQGTTYDVYVRSNCGGADSSVWVGPQTFNTSYAVPFFQDFENFPPATFTNPWPEGWSSYPDVASLYTFNWQSEDATGANENNADTGPLYDHTQYGTTGGDYIYLESSYTGAAIDFISPPVYVDTGYPVLEMTFWYHMFGATMGDLMVLVDTNGVQDTLMTITGQQQINQTDPWYEASAYLVGYAGKSVQLVFRGSRGTSYTGDMSIDDVRLDPVVQLSAKVDEVVSPSGALCPGSVIPSVSIENSGIDTITTVDVSMKVNGTVVATVTVNKTMATGDTALAVFPAVTVTAGVLYDIDFYTEDPNSGTDLFNNDDTLKVVGLSTGLSGTATINASQPVSATNFQSFSALADKLNSVGICGNVTINVAAGTYNDQFILDQIPGVDANNRVTIDGGDSSLVILENNLSAINAMIRFNRTRYVTVKNMTIRSTYTGSGQHWGVHFTGNSQHDSVINCRVLLFQGTSSGGNVIGASATITSSSTEGKNASYNTVMNCDIQGGYYGVHFEGSATGIYDNIGNKFINNRVRFVRYYGFYTDGQDSLEIIGNDISEFTNATGSSGLMMYDPMNFKINANKSVAYTYGLYINNANSAVYSNGPAEIINNMLSSSNSYGMYMATPILVNIWHNSVYAGGTADAVYLTNTQADSLDFRNNIIYTETSECIYTQGLDSNIFLKFDNNVFYSGGTSLLNFANTTYASLAAYQLVQSGFTRNFNSNSLEGDPQFLSTTDLHIVGPFVNNTGDNFVPVATDIDGDVRPFPFSTTVDPGADEHDPPTCPPPLALRVYNAGLDSVTVIADGAGQNYQYEWVASGANQGTGTLGVMSADSVRIGGLSPSSSYDIYVREVCGRGDSSLWIGPISFSTAFIVPYFQDFEAFPVATYTNPWPEGWSSYPDQTTPNSFNWQSEDATGFNENNGLTGPLYDHTQFGIAGGDYIYLESSYYYNNTDADFISPPIYMDSSQSVVELTFWYFMYGATTDDLIVLVESNGVQDTAVVLSGQQQTRQEEEWRQMAVFLNGYENQTIQLIFRGTSGTSYTGDIAIDDVAIDEVFGNDAKVAAMISPSLPICPGTTTPVVGVRNNGSDTITTVDVVASVNGVLDTVTHNGQILPGDTASVTMISMTINASTVYDVQFYTLNPNGMADEDVADDTLNLFDLQTGLVTGNYTVNSGQVTGGTNFASFTDLANAVNTFGLCGAINVDVVVGSGPYQEQFVLMDVEGSSSANTITINGHGEYIIPRNTSNMERAGILIENTSYVAIDSLNVDVSSATYAWGVQFTGDVHYCSITNSRIDADSLSTSSNDIPVVMNSSRNGYSSGFSGSHITVDNCELVGGYFNITAYGLSTNRPHNITITNNYQHDFHYYGIYSYYLDTVLIEGNDLSRANRPSVTTLYGIMSQQSNNATINRNAVHSTGGLSATSSYSAYPIYVGGTATDNVVSNNLVYSIDNVSGTIYGIYNTGISGFSILNNTISLDDTSSTGGITRGYYQTNTGTNTQFINNIISISRGGSGVKHGIYINNASSPATVDYNDVYMNSLGIGAQSYGYQGADHVDLDAWQTNTNFGANSFEVDPQFNNLPMDSLVPFNALINATALSTPLVTEDFYGVPRTLNPDFGAIEFDPPPVPNAGMASLINPITTADYCYTASEAVMVSILNAGGILMDLSVDTAIVTVNVTGAVTQTLTMVLNDNSNNGNNPVGLGLDFDLNMGPLNMTTPGTYNFEAIINQAGDNFQNNDTLRETVIVNSVSGGIIEGNDTICMGDSTELITENYQGTLQWQVLVGTTWTDVAGDTMTSLIVKPSVATSYRVMACGTTSSDSITVVPLIVPIPTIAKNDSIVVTCGNPGSDTLIVNVPAGAKANWYDAPTGGSLLNNSDTMIYSVNTSAPANSTADTFYVATTTGGGGADTALPVPHGSVYSGSTRGYHFVAPVDFTITGLEVAIEAGAGTQNVAVLQTDNNVAWNLWSTPITPFTTLFLSQNAPAAGYIPCNIPIKAGDVIGIFGARGTANSYSTASSIVIDGQTVPIQRFIMQANLNATAPAAVAQLGYEASASISRVNFTYSTGCESPRIMVIGRVDCTVGIDRTIGETASLSIYPNPSDGLFTLNINSPQRENFNLTVRDLQGKVVYTENVNVNGTYQEELDFANFAKGVYYMQIQTDSDSRVEKLIIQ